MNISKSIRIRQVYYVSLFILAVSLAPLLRPMAPCHIGLSIVTVGEPGSGRYIWPANICWIVINATPTIVGEAFIFYVWTFFCHAPYIAARRRSGTRSKVYQWLGPRCRQKVTRKNFANRPPPLIFTRGQKVRNLASILKISRLWRALVSKRSNISEI